MHVYGDEKHHMLLAVYKKQLLAKDFEDPNYKNMVDIFCTSYNMIVDGFDIW